MNTSTFLSYLSTLTNKSIADAARSGYIVYEGVASDINAPLGQNAGIPEPSGLDGEVGNDEYFDSKNDATTIIQRKLNGQTISNENNKSASNQAIQQLIDNNAGKNGFKPNIAPKPQRTSLGIGGTPLPQNICAST